MQTSANDVESDDIMEEECAICQEPLLVEKAKVTLPCKHSYCSDCLQSWRSKYDSTSGRTCPQCRQKIPPTKEMVSQLENLRHVLDWAKTTYEKYKDEPRKGMMEPVFDDMADVIPRTAMLPIPEEQKNEFLRELMRGRIESVEKEVARKEAAMGDFNTEDLLEQDPNAAKVLDLPNEICLAAAHNNIAKVLEWLGKAPVLQERIDAKNPDKMYRTLLHEAEFENHLMLMSVLLQLGASVDPLSSSGMTPLGQACSMALELEPAARLLLEWGAEKTEPGQTETTWELAEDAGNRALAALIEAPLGGRRCEIVGLKQRPDLNGLTGVAQAYVPSTDRYRVQVEQTKEWVKIRPQNLKQRNRTPTDPGIYHTFLGQGNNRQNGFQSILIAPLKSSDGEATATKK
jgi:hypothetical protein